MYVQPARQQEECWQVGLGWVWVLAIQANLRCRFQNVHGVFTGNFRRRGAHRRNLSELALALQNLSADTQFRPTASPVSHHLLCDRRPCRRRLPCALAKRKYLFCGHWLQNYHIPLVLDNLRHG